MRKGLPTTPAHPALDEEGTERINLKAAIPQDGFRAALKRLSVFMLLPYDSAYKKSARRALFDQAGWAPSFLASDQAAQKPTAKATREESASMSVAPSMGVDIRITTGEAATSPKMAQ